MANYAVKPTARKASTSDITANADILPDPISGSGIAPVSGGTPAESRCEQPEHPSDLPVVLTGNPVIGLPDGIIQTCPKYHTCNAPICPLDADWKLRLHLSGEAVCRYLREWAKIQSGTASKATFECDLPVQAQNRIAEAYPEILDSHAAIKSAMERAARTPSKMIKGTFGNVRKVAEA